MPVNNAAFFAGDIENYIAEQVLPLTQRQLCAYSFGDKLTLPKNRGTTYTASRYNRIPLPFAPLSEGVPPAGQVMVLEQVSAVAQQWGDTVTVSDVSDLTIKHPTFQTAIRLVSMQQAETVERNTFNALMAGTQINYVNTRGSRAALLATDYLNSHEVNRMVGALRTIGAWEYMAESEEDVKVTAGKPSKASSSPKGFRHYVSIMHTLVEQDMREDSTVSTAWSRSDINKLYNNELGEWGGVRFCRSNMVPVFTGGTISTGTPGAAGNLNDGTYYITITGSDAITGYETLVKQVSAGITTVAGPGAGSIDVTVPATAGMTYNVYIGNTVSTANLATSASGPLAGPLAGMAVMLPAGATVTLLDFGGSQSPPAAPANGVTVYPTFIFGRNAYGIVMLDDVKYTYLKDADKLDPLNQLRTVGWKLFYGTIILNQNFFGRIESSSHFSATFG
jgi:N4-gp56 family major capsid protein